ncbi:MAG TPA: DUF2917 domain-containing protein [Burkholderiales bacterium]|nr:DUF2917 domain-containing protein [Burkholderiales bacterium]
MNANEYPVHGSIGMTRGSVLRIEDGCDLRLHVWEGGLWLTQQGDARDRYVGAGEWFRLDRNGLAVASALQRTTMTITAPSPELYAERITLSRSGSRIAEVLYSAAAAHAPLAARVQRFWARLFAPHAKPTTAAL